MHGILFPFSSARGAMFFFFFGSWILPRGGGGGGGGGAISTGGLIWMFDVEPGEVDGTPLLTRAKIHGRQWPNRFNTEMVDKQGVFLLGLPGGEGGVGRRLW
jgi:hypothetical protein